MQFDLSASGGPEAVDVAEMVKLAAMAKAKVKRFARGWSQLSQLEILALVWFADLYLEDGALPALPPAISEEPQRISDL